MQHSSSMNIKNDCSVLQIQDTSKVAYKENLRRRKAYVTIFTEKHRLYLPKKSTSIYGAWRIKK